MNNYEIDFIEFKNNFKKYSNLELKQYATQIGLPENGNKNELYNKIEKYYLIKINLEYESKLKQSVNSFNKEQPKLDKSNLSQSEISFWKCFRNKAIFKKVFSNFEKSKFNSYDRLYSTFKILQDFSNGLEILKDKIKSNSFISLEENDIQSIFISVHENKVINIQDFYNSLISKYCNKSIHSMKLLKTILKFSNKESFISYKPTLNQVNQILVTDFKEIFKIASYQDFKFINFLFNYFKNQTIKLKEIKIENFISPNNEITLKQFIKFIKSIYLNRNNFKLLLNLNEENVEMFNQDYQFDNKYLNMGLLNSLKQLSNDINSQVNQEQKNEHFKIKEILKYFNYYYFIIGKHSKDNNTEFEKLFHSNIDKMIVENNNINSIKKKILIDPLFTTLDHISDIFKSIDSTTELDFLFKNYQDQFYQNLNSYWQHLQNLELVEYYEKQIKNLNRKLGFQLSTNNDYQYKLLIRSHYNPEIYVPNITVKSLVIKFNQVFKNPNNTIDLIETGLFETITFSTLGGSDDNSKKNEIKFLKWVYNNCINLDSIQSNASVFTLLIKLKSTNEIIKVKTERCALLVMLYYENRLDIITKSNVFYWSSFEIDYLLNINSPHSSIDFLDKLLKYIYSEENTQNLSFTPSTYLQSMIVCNNLPKIKFLTLNHCYLFSSINQKILFMLSKIAIENDFLQIVEILLIYKNISDKEILKIINNNKYSLINDLLLKNK